MFSIRNFQIISDSFAVASSLWIKFNSTLGYPTNCLIAGHESYASYTVDTYIARRRIAHEIVVGKTDKDSMKGYCE